jgi:hypothetical protein
MGDLTNLFLSIPEQTPTAVGICVTRRRFAITVTNRGTGKKIASCLIPLGLNI